MMKRAEHSTVLVTGASTGVGCAIATHLAQNGYRVFGTSREPSRVNATPYPLSTLDVRDAESVARCLREIGEDIDVLINNAGYAFVGAVEETTLDDARAQMETNFFGALRMMRAVLPSMRRRRRGRIVSVSSLSGVIAPPFLAAYAASKHALEGLSESLSFEVRPHGIFVSTVQFDSMQTGIAFARPAKAEEAYAAPGGCMLSRLERGSQKNGGNPTVVAQCVGEILASESPRLRWTVGGRSARVVAMRKLLPQKAFASLARRELGLREER